MIRTILRGTASLLFLTLLTFSSTQAQKIIKQGALAIEESEPTDDLNGNNIVPPLQEDEGMVRLLVEENLFVNSDQLLQWIKEGRFTIQGLRFESNQVRKRPDESIVFKFNFRFLSGTDQVARRIQIRTDEFKTYFKSHRFYKQKVITLTLKVEEEPVYDQPLEINGKLAVGLNVEGAEVIAIDQNGEERGRRFAVGSALDMELPVGVYQLVVRKTGYQEKMIQDVEIKKDEETAQIIDLEEIVVQKVDDSKALVEFRVNADRTNIVLLSERGTQQGLLAFDNIARAEVEPGRYNVICTKSDFIEQTFTIQASVDSAVVKDVRMVRTGETKQFVINSSPRGADVFLNDKNMGRTPITISKPEREIFNVRIAMKDFQTHEEIVDFALINEYEINKVLKPSYIDFMSRAESSNRSIGAEILVNEERIGVAPMRFHNPPDSQYTITLRKDEYEDLVEEVDLTEPGFAIIDTKMRKKRGQLRVANAQYNVPMNITVSGKTLDTDTVSVSGNGELIDEDLRFGQYEITIGRPGFKTIVEPVKMESYNQDFFYEMQPKSKGGAFILSAIIPGAGQMYWGQKGKGWLLLLGTAGAVAGVSVLGSEYNAMVDDFNAGNATQEDLDASYEQLEMVAGVALGLYGLNLLDRLLAKSPKRMMKKNKRSTALAGTQFGVAGAGVGVTIPLR